MSRLTDLLRATKQLDPQLGADLESELLPLQKRLPFGLNFERHAPEAAEIPGHKIRRGVKVRILPPRGSTFSGDKKIWIVSSVQQKSATVISLPESEEESRTVSVDDLVVVSEFRDTIFPGLLLDKLIEKNDSKPFHTVINGENFHALELLTFTHHESIDAIYIDPPYNTGSRDWKYNNDYVESDDLYRHSKWLAFMERRLKLAKRLLRPENSVLIVTIDEKEYLRLGMLLEQVFPSEQIQMVSTVINPMGSRRAGLFSRVEEYIYFVLIGDARVPDSVSNMLSEKNKPAAGAVRWTPLNRDGNGWERRARPNLFFPIFVNKDNLKIEEIGNSIQLDANIDSVVPRDNCQTVWPMKRDKEARWQVSPDTARKLLIDGFLTVGSLDPERSTGTVRYLTSGAQTKIENGDYIVVGSRRDGSKIVHDSGISSERPRSIWNQPSHSARDHGSSLLSALIPDRKFPFPKSLYAVEDALRFFVQDKPDAVVLDFFSGSGTTAHAVMRLNNQDSGRRQAILVTNNEVSAEEQLELRKAGLRPGDPEWEERGICSYVTKPRIQASITGLTPEGQELKGDYKFIDEFPMADGFDENAAFFTLAYESPWRISTDRAFATVAPMLWLRAGAIGHMIDSMTHGWEVADSYGIINDLDQAANFVRALKSARDIQIAYIVTDDEGRYQQIANEIPGIETVRLYEDYLLNCKSTGDF